MTTSTPQPSPVIRIGISGWIYVPWRGTFYPPDLAQKNELPYASAALSSIEINGTFYGLQKPKSYASWYAQTPASFVFSLKAPRYITHIKRLKDCTGPIANFLLSGPLRLNEKLGPILWQFPPSMKFDAPLFESFLALLPHTTKAAAQMLPLCDGKLKDTWDQIDHDRPLRHAVEIRHDSFVDEKFAAMLRRHNTALVCADTAGIWPMLHDTTADFIYCRLHGAEQLYASGYTEEALDQWAAKIHTWSHGGQAPGPHISPPDQTSAPRDVYVYFDNDVKVRSPFDAARLAHKLGLRSNPLPEPPFPTVTEEPRDYWPPVKNPAPRRHKKIDKRSLS